MVNWQRAALAASLSLLAACGGQQAPATPPLLPRQAASVTVVAPASPYWATVQKLYLAYFGRPADPGGWQSFAAQLQAIDAPLETNKLTAAYQSNPAVRALIDSFAASQESRDLYPDDNAAFIDAVYANLFGRKPDGAGRAYWINALDRKELTRPNAALAVLSGAVGADITMVRVKTEYATQFTKALNTPARVGAYSGSAAAAMARILLTDAYHNMTPGIMAPKVASTVAALEVAASADKNNYIEVQAAPRRIALVASSAQLATNGARLAQLATVLAGDLNARDSLYGPVYRVDVLPAESTARDIARQLKAYDGAILIGMVALPINPGYGYGRMLAVDAYRLPDCPAFVFGGDGNTLATAPQLTQVDPKCRTGMMVSFLRGTSAAHDVAEVAVKLDQMIAYHKASAAANAGWKPSYQFVYAGWFGGNVLDDMTPSWRNVSLFAQDQIQYRMSGNSKERMSAFRDCIGSNAEMCVFNGHGSATVIQTEGPGLPTDYYSDDATLLNSSDILPQSVNAKFISLVSCSTQNMSVEQFIGNKLLMSGKTLLTHGFSTNVFVSSQFEHNAIKSNYDVLATGGTLADAYRGEVEGGATVFQGDPYITMRSAPAGATPKLAIDGKRYHGAPVILPVALPPSIGGATSSRTLLISNPGQADLKIKLGISVRHNGVDRDGSGKVDSLGNVSGHGLSLAAPYQYLAGDFHKSSLNDNAITIKPGEALPVTYSLGPWYTGVGIILQGMYYGRIEIQSNDPAAPRVYLELSGKVSET